MLPGKCVHRPDHRNDTVGQIGSIVQVKVKLGKIGTPNVSSLPIAQFWPDKTLKKASIEGLCLLPLLSRPAQAKKCDFAISTVSVTLHHHEREKTMKTFLALAAATGLSVTAASAECSWHSKVTASVDTQTKTASVENTVKSSVTDETAIKKDAPAKGQ